MQLLLLGAADIRGVGLIGQVGDGQDEQQQRTGLMAADQGRQRADARPGEVARRGPHEVGAPDPDRILAGTQADDDRDGPRVDQEIGQTGGGDRPHRLDRLQVHGPAVQRQEHLAHQPGFRAGQEDVKDQLVEGLPFGIDARRQAPDDGHHHGLDDAQPQERRKDDGEPERHGADVRVELVAHQGDLFAVGEHGDHQEQSEFPRQAVERPVGHDRCPDDGGQADQVDDDQIEFCFKWQIAHDKAPGFPLTLLADRCRWVRAWNWEKC